MNSKTLVVGPGAKRLGATLSSSASGRMRVSTWPDLHDVPKQVRRQAPDVVVLHMIEGTYEAGIGAVRWLRNDDRFRNTPIALVTDLASKGDWLNVRDVLFEPLGPAELFQALMKIAEPFGTASATR